MIADAARRSSAIDVDTIVSRESLRRAGFQAAAACIALGLVLFAARGPARQAVDAASLTLFPDRVDLQVTPGNARIKAGTPLAIEARLVGNRAPIIAQVQIADGDRWRERRDDRRRCRRVPPDAAVGRRAVRLPRRRRRGDVADLRGRGRDSAAGDAHRRPLHLSRGAAACAAHRNRRRRHLCPGRHRRPRSGVHRPACRDRSDDARRRQADRAHLRHAEPSCPRR